MSRREITVLTDVALITCIVQRGNANVIINAARDAGATGASVHYARGTGVRERLGILGITIEAEKAVINIVVATDQIDRVFEKLYVAGKIETPGMGFMYVTPLEKAATHIPNQIIEKISGVS